MRLAWLVQRFRPWRVARRAWLRVGRRSSLARRYLIAAIVLVATSMFLLGNWIGAYLETAITYGVAETAAASIESVIVYELGELPLDRPLDAADAERLDAVFQIASDAQSTRLLDVRIRRLDGSLIYQSSFGLIDVPHPGNLHQAADSGTLSAAVLSVPLVSDGSVTGQLRTVLKIYAPLRRVGTDDVVALAELYYGARALNDLKTRARLYIWLLVGIIGAATVAALYFMVRRASRTIDRQRLRLGRNLLVSRQLAEENSALHAASEQLRLDASIATETLLSQTGSDLHDGPVQLLTLVVLRLGVMARHADPATAQALKASGGIASDAIEELRDISSGLVLPELHDLSLTQAIELALARHEGMTGTHVGRALHALPENCAGALKVCAYRIVQEALSNAFRHGNHGTSQVDAHIVDDHLLLTIQNTVRRRKPVGRARRSGGLGLRGMRLRAESLGGTLHADLQAAGVATISARIPLRLSVEPEVIASRR